MSTKVRQSNFELLRLVSMLMVMVAHANGYVNEADLVGADGIAKVIVNQFCLISVNVFVMISGWFGIKASWKGACSLLFQVAFLGLLSFLFFALIGHPVSFKTDLFPYLFFGYHYWFVIAYLVLYALSPILNKFCENASKKESLTVLVMFFLTEFIYGFLLGEGQFAFGFSALSFIGLYLLARYARLYPIRLLSMNKGKDMAIYLGLSLLSIVGLWFGYKWFGMGFHLNHYDSPLAIAASLFFLLFFSKLKFQSKAVNWLAASAFAIYLLHENSLISPYYHQIFNRLHESLPLVGYYFSLFGLVLLIGLVCIFNDKIRIFVWELIVRCVSPKASTTLKQDEI